MVGAALLVWPSVTMFLWRKPSAAGSGDRTGSLLPLELATADVAPDSLLAFGDMVLLLELELPPELPKELKSR